MRDRTAVIQRSSCLYKKTIGFHSDRFLYKFTRPRPSGAPDICAAHRRIHAHNWRPLPAGRRTPGRRRSIDRRRRCRTA